MAEGEHPDARRQIRHREHDPSLHFFEKATEGTRERTSDWMGDCTSQPPVPISGRIQFSSVASFPVGPDRIVFAFHDDFE